MTWKCSVPVLCLLQVIVAGASSALPLFFTAEPEDAIASFGGTVALYCNVTTTNGEEANVTWFKEGEAKLAPSRGSILILSHNADIKHELKEKEKRKIEGSYYCEAQTKILAIRSRSALVKLEHYERATATEGSSFHLNDIVSATASGNFKNVYWKIQCNSIEFTCPSQNRFVCPFFYEELVTERLMRQSLLRIDYNGLQRQGDSTCQKNDPIKLYMLGAQTGKMYVKQFNYNAKSHRPRLYLQPQSLSKQRGHNVTLICQGSNLGNRYIWYKDHKSLSESPRVKMNNGTLFITDVRMQDTGTYTCQSSSGKYTKTKTASLIVYDVPNVSCGNQTCNASGSNISEVLLIRNGVILKRMPVDCSSVNLRLHLSGANEGIYQCLANSKYGSAQKSIYLANRIWNETVNVNVERPAHCSNYSKQVTLTLKRTTPKPAIHHQSTTSSEDITILNDTTPSTSVKATSTPSTDPSLGEANVTTTPSFSSTMGSVKANSTETTLGQANSATTQPTPKAASVKSMIINTDSPATGSNTRAAISTGATTSLTESTTGGSTENTSVKSAFINKDSPDSNAATTTVAAAKPPVSMVGRASPTTVPATDGTRDNNIEPQTATINSQEETPSIPETIPSHHLESLIAVGTALGGVIIVLSVVIIILVGKGRKVVGLTEISPKPTTIYPLFSNPSYATTGRARATQVEAVYETIPGDRTSKEVKKPTTTVSAYEDVSINLEKPPNANETEQKTSTQDYVNAESIPPSMLTTHPDIRQDPLLTSETNLVLHYAIIGQREKKRVAGNLPKAQCQSPRRFRLKGTVVTIKENHRRSFSNLEPYTNDHSARMPTQESKKALQMPDRESAIYATIDSCLLRHKKIPNSTQNQDDTEESKSSDCEDVEKCCKGCPGCAAISHGEQRGSAIAHVSINEDDYAMCQKETTSQQHSTDTLSRESKIKHMAASTVGEDEHALCEKKAENQSKVPDHFTANGCDTYAVSMKSKETSSSTKES